MPEIVAITVAVNYADILKHVLNQNSTFFKKWVIVTSPDDVQTMSLINNSNKANIQLLIYNDFYIKGSMFNKGGALRFAQEHVYHNYKNENVLILDADILLPINFLKKLPLRVENNTLYGVSERLDYWSVDDFNNDINPHLHSGSKQFVGFFQLYKQSAAYKYERSVNCSKCDDKFRNMFKKKILLDLSVKHLGRPRGNWDGVVGKVE